MAGAPHDKHHLSGPDSAVPPENASWLNARKLPHVLVEGKANAGSGRLLRRDLLSPSGIDLLAAHPGISGRRSEGEASTWQ